MVAMQIRVGAQPARVGIPQTLVVAARLGDAPWHAASCLLRGHARALTLFAGPLRAAGTRREQALERYRQDEAAMRVLGTQSIRLAEPDTGPAGRGRPAQVAVLAACLGRYLAGTDEIWLPAAVEGDHCEVMTRDAGIRAAAAAHRDIRIWLYDDVPAGAADPGTLTLRAAELEQLLSPALVQPLLIGLDEHAQRTKATVLACYRSSGPTQPGSQNTSSQNQVGLELAWRMSGPGGCGSPAGADAAGDGEHDAARDAGA